MFGFTLVLGFERQQCIHDLRITKYLEGVEVYAQRARFLRQPICKHVLEYSKAADGWEVPGFLLDARDGYEQKDPGKSNNGDVKSG